LTIEKKTLTIASMNEKNWGIKLIKLFLWFLFLSFFVVAFFGVFLLWKVNQTENKITLFKKSPSSFLDTFKNISLSSNSKLKGEDTGRINILLLGIAGKGNPGENLSDTLMIASLNTKNNQVALLSLPRDLYASIPEDGVQMKINSMYQYGKSLSPGDPQETIIPLQKTLGEITSLDINYWLILNFEGFKKIIDAVGGINIMNERDIFDSSYPGPNYSYQIFELKKGFYNNLDGETALKYARMRHNDPEGDFGRAKRQQQVLQATRNKIFSTETFLNPNTLNDLFNALGDNIKTDIPPSDFGSFLSLAKNLDTSNIINIVVDAWDKNSLLKVSHLFYKDVRAFILVPRVGNWSEIQELAQNIFDTEKIKRRRQEIAKEDASVSILNKSSDSNVGEKIENLLRESFGYKNITKISSLEDKKNPSSEKSFLCDFSSKNNPFTLDELTTKIPAEIIETEKPECDLFSNDIKTDILVVVGKDVVTQYNLEEDSFEEYKNSEDNFIYSDFLEKSKNSDQ